MFEGGSMSKQKVFAWTAFFLSVSPCLSFAQSAYQDLRAALHNASDPVIVSRQGLGGRAEQVEPNQAGMAQDFSVLEKVLKAKDRGAVYTSENDPETVTYVLERRNPPSKSVFEAGTVREAKASLTEGIGWSYPIQKLDIIFKKVTLKHVGGLFENAVTEDTWRISILENGKVLESEWRHQAGDGDYYDESKSKFECYGCWHDDYQWTISPESKDFQAAWKEIVQLLTAAN